MCNKPSLDSIFEGLQAGIPFFLLVVTGKKSNRSMINPATNEVSPGSKIKLNDLKIILKK
jgi:hypothetical protein